MEDAPKQDRPARRDDRGEDRKSERKPERRRDEDRRDRGGRDAPVVGMGDHVPDFLLRGFSPDTDTADG